MKNFIQDLQCVPCEKYLEKSNKRCEQKCLIAKEKNPEKYFVLEM